MTIENDLQYQNDQMKLLLEVSKAIAAEKATAPLAQVIVDGITKLTRLKSAAIYLLQDNKLYLQATCPPLPPKFPEALRIAELHDHPHIGKAVSSKRPVVLEDCRTAILTDAEREVCEQRQLRSILYVPLTYQGDVIGVLIPASIEITHEFTEDDINLCQTLASHAALSLSEAMLAEEKQSYIAEIEAKNKSLILKEKAIRESEEKHRRLFETMAQGVIYQDSDGKIISANPAAERMLGLSFEQMQGKTSMDPHWQMIEEDGTPLTGADHPTMIALRTGQKIGPVTRGIFHPGKNSHIWLSITAIPLFKPEKEKPFQSYATFIDITEQKQAEESLRLNTIVLNQIKDHVTITDLNGDIVYVNQAEIDSQKKPREKLIGANIDIFGESLDRGAKQREIREMTIRNGTWSGEVINYNADGQELIFYCRTQVVYDEHDKPIALCGISTDISEQKQAEEEIRTLNEKLEERVKERTAQLEAANRELDAFTYSASHDLRGPLNRISGFSEALLEDHSAQLDPQGKDYLRRITNSSRQMGELIDDLLKLSKVSQHQISHEPVELSALVNVCLKELQAREPGRQVETIITSGLVAKADTALIRIALENLLNNAWKFSASKELTRIEFGSTTQEGKEVYFIRDNGTGFDMKHAEKLFAAFQRLHDAKTYPGTGIGLSIVSRIIHRHGGEIWAEGEPGKEACFYFTLP